ncbi:MAG: hypothetical protein CM1200mP30_00140 [Pseudomonadota bacterium]|nr:MAG: hypothetical protein CM1200mP30_00140 [Pseudomonadota bacterium]
MNWNWTWVFRSVGVIDRVADVDKVLIKHKDHWLINEIIQFLKRVFKRPLSCLSQFGHAGRTRQLLCWENCWNWFLLRTEVICLTESSRIAVSFPAVLRTTEMNFGKLPMCNDLTRFRLDF